MPRRLLRSAMALWVAANVVHVGQAHASGCEDVASGIPPRSHDAMSGSAFAQRVAALEGLPRDAEILAELLAGDMPERLRHLAPVTMSGRSTDGRAVDITLCVTPDYLAIGSDDNSLLVPMGLPSALRVAIRYGFVLPTVRMVDAIYEAATVKLAPIPLTAGPKMRSTAYVVHHSEMIAEQRAHQFAPPGALAAGHKKDLVLTDRLLAATGRVAIYGWHRGPGEPIQPLSTVHGERYADYSHGVRLVSRTVYVNGVRRSMDDVLADRTLSALLTSDAHPVSMDSQGVVSVLQQRNPKW